MAPFRVDRRKRVTLSFQGRKLMCTRHLGHSRFGGTPPQRLMSFETGTIRRSFSSGTNAKLIEFAIQYKGQTLRHGVFLPRWMQEKRKEKNYKAGTDYDLHCIITDLGSAQIGGKKGKLVFAKGVSHSFQAVLWPIPGLMLDGCHDFSGLWRQGAAKHSGLP